MKSVIIAICVALGLVLFMAKPGQAINCNQIENYLAPCLPYLTTGNGSPNQACCNGISSLRQSTPNKADRQQACLCIKNAATRFQDIKNDAAKNLPIACKVQIDIPISLDVNCQDVQ